MNSQSFQSWLASFPICQHQARLSKPLIMGVINMTPVSLSQVGRFGSVDQAFQHAQHLIASGVDIIDLGGESSRPGSLPVSTDEELHRIIPLVERLRQESDVCLSIDTVKPAVMRAALAAGANVINDISALHDEEALQLAVESGVPVCLMHKQGDPVTMQADPGYHQDVVDEINDFFTQQIQRCLQAGMAREQLILDPGFGFGKTLWHNLWLTKHLHRFTVHSLPILFGASRKHSIGLVLNKPPEDRMIGSIATAIYANLQGAAIIRTHDVDETNQALLMIEAIVRANNKRVKEDESA